MMDRIDRAAIRRRTLEEIQRLHREMQNCHHCASLRQQMARLYGVMPPEPVFVGNLRYDYIGPLNVQHVWHDSAPWPACLYCGVAWDLLNARDKCPALT